MEEPTNIVKTIALVGEYIEVRPDGCPAGPACADEINEVCDHLVKTGVLTQVTSSTLMTVYKLKKSFG